MDALHIFKGDMQCRNEAVAAVNSMSTDDDDEGATAGLLAYALVATKLKLCRYQLHMPIYGA